MVSRITSYNVCYTKLLRTLEALITSFGAKNWFSRFKAMNREEIEVEDERTGKVKKVPHPDSVAAWA